MAGDAFDDILELQFAGNEEAFRRLVHGHEHEVWRHLEWDAAFIVALGLFVVALVATCLAARGPEGWVLRPYAWVIGAAPIAADVTENVLLKLAVDDRPWLAAPIEVVAAVKWLAYAALTVALVTSLAGRLWFPFRVPPEPEFEEPPPGTDTVTARWPERSSGVGIALSGGGIRSAAFALGALGALGNDKVRDARYLSAASGGAYLAAAMTLQAHRDYLAGDPEEELPFRHGTDELARLRARSSYLSLNGADGRVGVFRAVAAITFNLVVLWLVVFAVGRPVGWLISTEGLHPELLARTPLIETAELDRDVDDDDLDAQPAGLARCGEVMGRRFLVQVAPSHDPRTIETKVALEHTTSRTTDKSLPVTFVPAEVEVCGGVPTITAQPRAQVVLGELADVDSRQDTPRPPLVEVTRQLTLELDGDSAVMSEGPGVPSVDEQLDERLRVDRQPAFEQRTGFRGRPGIDIEGWMLAVPGLALVLALVWSAVLQRGSTLRISVVPAALLWVSVGTAALFVVLPWLLQAMPTLGDRIYELLPGTPEAVPGEPRGFLVWLSALVAAGQSVRVVLTRVRPNQSRVGRSSRLAAKVVAFVLVAAAGLALLLAVIQQGALNGPQGRLSGFGAFWLGANHVPDLARWGLVVGVLGLLAVTRPAHHWSFLPLYRDRLAEAFSLTEEPISSRREQARPQLAPLTDCRSRDVPEDFRPRWPELVICAAVNLNDIGPANRIPAGRWADSFTFSPTEVGGPAVGYMPTPMYEDALSRSARADVTMPSVVAVSGAAFSPAMGKMAYGPIGGLFALLNLRLGLWLPHPAWVRETATEGMVWKRRPGWPYLLREVFGRFKRHRPFLYVTDGGHWENLGLVELFRRRCAEIYVISAAGDGDRSFATIAEAIALAREQCGVEIAIELSPMRPPVGDPPAAPPAAPPSRRRVVPIRQLLRRGSDGAAKAEPMAPATYAEGTFTYGTGRGRVKGKILIIEANLTADMPWDVHAWAESMPIFPDDPTSDQFFNHRQFESYRRLGQHQMETALASVDWST